MIFRFNARHLVLCMSLSAFFSCKKDDTATPTPPPSEPSVFEQVQGRWNAEIEAPPRHSNVSAKEQGIGQVAVVEFFSDSMYTIAFNSGYALTGKFKPADSAVINLSGSDITSVGNLKVSADSISFSYLHGDDTIAVKAAKADDLSISNDKKPILKSWLVDRNQEAGSFLYSQYQASQDAKIIFKFSSAGSFVFTIQDGSNQMSQFMNWKWHPDVANAALVYSVYGVTMYNSYFKLVSISNTSLTIEDVSIQQGGSTPITKTYVLTAQ